MTTQKWKLVPAEPDEQQIYAMRSAFYRARRGGAGGQTIDACYQRENAPELAAYTAMLKAAPQPPKLSDERIDKICDIVERDNVLFSQSGIYALARAIERELLGGGHE
jgi:hypothetical protein